MRRGAAGFTLIELLCVLAIAAVLACIAIPGYQLIVQKTRRADALAALQMAQMAQERYRADHRRYGSLDDIRAPAASPAGHYRLAVSSSEFGYEIHAVARGAQQSDIDCRHLTLRVAGTQTLEASGRDEAVGNPRSINRKCWGL
jgi:type IV pilus assembly protein PilE